VSLDRPLLAGYLRQLAELGVEDVVFEQLTPADALALLAGRGTAHAAPATTGPAPAAAAAAPAGLPGTGRVPAVASAHAAPASAPAASTRARGAPRLATLAAAARTCTLCRLHETRTQVVHGEGSEAARLVVVGEAPGQEEDRSGRPFVGRAGRLLDLLLLSAGFPRESVYICNVLKCRPPQNRNPLPDEVAACVGTHLLPQMAAVQPAVVLAVGKFAAESLLGTEESIGRLRGTVHSWQGTPLVVTYHPAYLLRSPQMTRVAWQDFQLVRKVLDEQT
jgi:uracil-DNA glycosylase